MAGRLVILILLFTIYTSDGMEMRETVERMVMVRRTGSDLQPAATGFIYKSDNSGPASVIKLGESDIHKHFDNLPTPHYEQPKSFAAPIPVAAGPFYNKEENEEKAASDSDVHVIPVVEENDDDKEDDHEKLFNEYASDFGDYKNNFDDYIAKYFGHLGDGFHKHEHGHGSDYGAEDHSEHGEKVNKGYASDHEDGKGGKGDYHTEKHDSYSVSSSGKHGKHFQEGDEHGSDFAHGKFYKGDDHGHKSGHSKGEETDGFHKLFNKEEFKKDNDVYDEEANKGGFVKYADGHAHYGSDAGGFKKGDSHESGHDETDFGKHGLHNHGSLEDHDAEHSAEEGGESFHHKDGKFGSEGGSSDGKSFGYEIKH